MKTMMEQLYECFYNTVKCNIEKERIGKNEREVKKVLTACLVKTMKLQMSCLIL